MKCSWSTGADNGAGITGMGWEEVDEGWGSRAKDWAYLMEPAWWPEFDQVLPVSANCSSLVARPGLAVLVRLE